MYKKFTRNPKGFSYVDLVHRQGHHYALVSVWRLPSDLTVCLTIFQKHMLLQVPEQKSSVEKEVMAHSMIQDQNVLQLICSEIQENKNDTSTAFLLFPYYRVSQSCLLERIITILTLCPEWHSPRSDGEMCAEWPGPH